MKAKITMAIRIVQNKVEVTDDKAGQQSWNACCNAQPLYEYPSPNSITVSLHSFYSLSPSHHGSASFTWPSDVLALIRRTCPTRVTDPSSPADLYFLCDTFVVLLCSRVVKIVFGQHVQKISKASQAFATLGRTHRSRNITTKTKIRLFKTNILNNNLYGARWLSGRMPDSQSSEPGFESPFATVSKIGHFRSFH